MSGHHVLHDSNGSYAAVFNLNDTSEKTATDVAAFAVTGSRLCLLTTISVL
jgi:hypothetical protein